MTKLLINLIDKRYNSEKRRSAYGILSGCVGIFCNLLLTAVKFVLGALTKSVSITADAVNNLTDSAANIVTIISAKLSQKPVDREHPFGHGRIEYISALIISFTIFVMSFELAKSSVVKILEPERLKFSAIYVIILVIAICVKLWMAYFNSRLYRITDNVNMKAVCRDSLNDCIATGATLVSLILSKFFGLYIIDGIIGLAVAVFIFISGAGILKDAAGSLLGTPPSKETVKRLESIIKDNDTVIDVHDIIIHSYGHDRYIASAHAEVPADSDLITVHSALDTAEKRISEEMNIDICIHADPVELTDSERSSLLKKTEKVIKEYNEGFSLHDFRLKKEMGVNEISFDLVIPFDTDGQTAERDIKNMLKNEMPYVRTNINTEYSYT